MPVTDAVNTSGSLVYVYDRWTTLLGPTDGTPPDNTDVFSGCEAVRVVQSAGGDRLDFADLTYPLTSALVNRVQPASFTRMVAVILPDSAETRIHLGDYVQETESVKQSGDELTASSQLRDYHFGSPVRGCIASSPLDGNEVTLDGPVMFNPEIDGETYPNKSSNLRTGYSSFRWTHPEAMRTVTAQGFHSDAPQLWELEYAVQSMCDLLNGSEDFIRNPDSASLSLLSTAPAVRAVEIPIGEYLPQALDRLLIPFGYNWYVNYDTGTYKPIIEIFKIGSGTQKELYLQAPAATLSLSSSNVNQYQVTRGIGDSFNQVRALGGLEQWEVTLPLIPGWPAADDSYTLEDLDKSNPESSYVGHELAWRQWVANEAGDIDESRVFGDLSCEVPALNTVFAKWIPARRNIDEPLTYAGGASSTERRPIFLEYSTDGGYTRQPMPAEWQVQLLPDQIGILFHGDMPPEELVNAGGDARVWITGTVTGDGRIEGVANRQSWAVNGRTVEVVLDCGDKFHHRERCEYGDYRSVLADTPNAADEVDGLSDIQAYAEKIRDQNHHAEVDAEFRLPGLHLYYEIGDLITKINGREISLDAASNTSPVNRYPQIVERRFEFGADGPSTVLIVDRGIPET